MRKYSVSWKNRNGKRVTVHTEANNRDDAMWKATRKYPGHKTDKKVRLLKR